MNKAIKYYSILLILAQGCAPKLPPGLTFEDSFANWQKEEVIEALAALPQNDATIASVSISYLDPGSPYIGQACVDCRPCRMRIHPHLKKSYYRTVVWHEYGHCWGLRHSEDPEDIMAASIYEFSHYGEYYLERFLEVLR